MAQQIGTIGLRALIVISIIIAGYYLFIFALPLVYPFIIGWGIALLIEPIIRLQEKKLHIPRWVAVTITLFLLLSLIISSIIFLVAEVVIELTRMADILPGYLNKISNFFVKKFTEDNTDVQRIIQTIQSYLEKHPQSQEQIAQSIKENIGLLAKSGTEFITYIIKGIASFLGNLPYLLTVLVFITLSAFFISIDLQKIRRRIIASMPSRLHKTGGQIYGDIKKALFGFLRAQLVLITITAIIMLVGLLILNVNYAFSIALFTGLVDLLPYLGVGAVMIPWIIYLLLTGGVNLAIGLIIVYAIIVIIRQILEPKLLASNVGLDPLLTLIAIFVGLKLFGVLGIIISPIIVVILMSLSKAYVFKDIYQFIMQGRVYH